MGIICCLPRRCICNPPPSRQGPRTKGSGKLLIGDKIANIKNDKGSHTRGKRVETNEGRAWNPPRSDDTTGDLSPPQ
jgi:hypothetical protein